MNRYIMTLDLGTTSARCIIFDKAGRAVGCARRVLNIYYPKEGFVEQSPDEYVNVLKGCALEALLAAKTTAARIDALGITNQRETVIFWDRASGRVITNAYVWQCNRGKDIVDALNDEEKQIIREKTGLVPNSYFSASKISWALKNVPGLREKAITGELAVGTPDSWLIYNLTGKMSHFTDYTNASRTMLFNINELAWDKELLEIFDIPGEILPEARPSINMYGEVVPDFCGAVFPIAGVAGDQQSALFGQCCFMPGDVKNTYGTGCFSLMNMGEKRADSHKGLLTTLTAASSEACPEYALEGSIFMCGALIDWLRDNMGFIKKSSETAHIAEMLEDNGGVYMVPALTGLGAPYWNANARALISGLGRESDWRHIVRAALEGIAYRSLDVLRAMEETLGSHIREIKADGGVSRNDFLMRFLANITDTDVTRAKFSESTALGAAFLAGLGSGVWKSKEEIISLDLKKEIFKSEKTDEWRQKYISGWERAIRLNYA